MWPNVESFVHIFSLQMKVLQPKMKREVALCLSEVCQEEAFRVLYGLFWLHQVPFGLCALPLFTEWVQIPSSSFNLSKLLLWDDLSKNHRLEEHNTKFTLFRPLPYNIDGQIDHQWPCSNLSWAAKPCRIRPDYSRQTGAHRVPAVVKSSRQPGCHHRVSQVSHFLLNLWALQRSDLLPNIMLTTAPQMRRERSYRNIPQSLKVLMWLCPCFGDVGGSCHFIIPSCLLTRMWESQKRSKGGEVHSKQSQAYIIGALELSVILHDLL